MNNDINETSENIRMAFCLVMIVVASIFSDDSRGSVNYIHIALQVYLSIANNPNSNINIVISKQRLRIRSDTSKS